MHAARTSRCMCRRPGFTRVELAVVLVIIALLASMILPGIYVTRHGPANSTMCLHNMRQIGLATINFASAHNGKFPEMVGEDNGEVYIDANKSEVPAPWTVAVLPLLEQMGLHDRLLTPTRSESFNELASWQIPVFVCPSLQANDEAAVNSYVVNGGYMTLSRWNNASRVDNGHSLDRYDWQADGVESITFEDQRITRATGVLFSGGTTHIDDIRDGTSTTILLSENI
ncbi:MAG: DUF1559 domain-containing protein, partial [Planctomycetaceae bacterium]|nr:DUF1559 domain-containing protein [Planctomycetaceae bacterium]